MKKGFTLVELVTVILILSLISILGFSYISRSVNKKQGEISDAMNKIITEAASMYIDYNKYHYPMVNNNVYCIQLHKLTELDFLSAPIIDPVDNSVISLDDYVKVSVDVDKYNYEVTNICDNGFSGDDDISPQISYSIAGVQGLNNYFTTDTYVSIDVSDLDSGVLSYKWCLGIDCTPNIEEVSNRKIKIPDVEETQICAIATDRALNESVKFCSNVIKVDSIKPFFTGIADIVVNRGDVVDLYAGVDVSDELSGLNGTFTVSPSEINTNVGGVTNVIYTASDNAGNVSSITRKVTVEESGPAIVYTSLGNINAQGWAKEDFYVTITALSDNSIREIRVCTSLTDTCNPESGSVVSEGAASRLISTEGYNRICAIAYDNSNKDSGVVCSDAYKLDKTAPTAGNISINGTLGSNGFYTSNVTIAPVNGTDSLSGHDTTTVSLSSITENTNGTVVTVTTTDKAGNTSSSDYTVKVDKTTPTVTIAKSVVSNSNRFTASLTPASNISGVTYKWYRNNTLISGAESSEYTTNEAGTYKAVVTTGAGISATSNEITVNSYTITYNLNGGEGSIPSTTKVENINVNITSTIPTRTGYSFLGWAESATSTEAYGSIYTLNSNKTLYAIWKKTLTITFVGNGATISKTSATCDIYNNETSCSITTPTITRSGYMILGFATNQNSQTKEIGANEQVSVNSNATYYAITKEVTLSLSSSIGTTYIGGNNITETISGTNYGTLTCRSSDTNVATCSITGTTLTIIPGTTVGSAVITVTEGNANLTYSYTFNNLDATYALNVTFTPAAGKINAQGWAKEDFYVTVTLTDTTSNLKQFKLCTALTDTCNPDSGSVITASTASRLISTESNNNRICIKAEDNLGRKSGVVCSDAYKLDKTIPSVSIAKSVVSNSNKFTASLATSNISGITYKWYKNNTLISGAESSEYITNNAGTYKAVVTTGSGISTTSNEITVNSYTITYNLNGGEGSIPSTTKVQDISTNITSTIPTRTNYTFKGWAESATSPVTYSSNSIYTVNASKTLYAIWEANLLYLADVVNLGDYISMTPTMSSYTVSKSLSGSSSDRSITPSELNLWRVIKINNDNTIEMVSVNYSSSYISFYRVSSSTYLDILSNAALSYKNDYYTAAVRIQQSSDLSLISSVFGTLVPNPLNGTMASNQYGFLNGELSGSSSFAKYPVINNSGDEDMVRPSSSIHGYLRPIATLKSGLSIASGNGTQSSPYVLNPDENIIVYGCPNGGTLTADSSKGASSGGYVCVQNASVSSYDCKYYVPDTAVAGNWKFSYSYTSSRDESTPDDISRGYDIDCTAQRYCPSGWNTYSGSGSSMKCYINASVE